MAYGGSCVQDISSFEVSFMIYGNHLFAQAGNILIRTNWDECLFNNVVKVNNALFYGFTESCKVRNESILMCMK